MNAQWKKLRSYEITPSIIYDGGMLLVVCENGFCDVHNSFKPCTKVINITSPNKEVLYLISLVMYYRIYHISYACTDLIS